MLEDSDELELYALTERIQFEVVLIDSIIEDKSLIDNQDIRAIQDSTNVDNKNNNYLPAGKYWIGTLAM